MWVYTKYLRCLQKRHVSLVIMVYIATHPVSWKTGGFIHVSVAIKFFLSRLRFANHFAKSHERRGCPIWWIWCVESLQSPDRSYRTCFPYSLLHTRPRPVCFLVYMSQNQPYYQRFPLPPLFCVDDPLSPEHPVSEHFRLLKRVDQLDLHCVIKFCLFCVFEPFYYFKTE